MFRTPRTQQIASIAALTIALLLVMAGPAAASTTGGRTAGESPRELDGWIYGRGAASSTDNVRFSDDGWARGQGMRNTTEERGGFVDGWAVARGARDTVTATTEQRGGFVDGWAIGQGMRSQTVVSADPSPAPVRSSIPTPYIALGLLLAAALGAVTATVLSHHRHVPSAH